MPNKLPSSLSYLCPFECDLERVGGHRDGGYVLPSRVVRDTSHLFSVGISNDWSFEETLNRMNKRLRIFAFDRSVGSLVFLYIGFRDILKRRSRNTRNPESPRFAYAWTWIKMSARFRWFFRGRRGFARRWVKPSQSSKKEITFSEAMSRVPRTGSIIIKIDIEGDEYGLREQIKSALVDRQGQIAAMVFELHDTEDRRAEFEQFVTEIGALMPVVHIHGNNCRAYGSDGLPTFVEVTFARSDLVGESRVLEFPRTGLDYPNDSELPELEFVFESPMAH